jgi:hypothetical protein
LRGGNHRSHCATSPTNPLGQHRGRHVRGF